MKITSPLPCSELFPIHRWIAVLPVLLFTVGLALADTRLSPPVQTAWRAAERTAHQTHWQAVTLRTNTVTGKVHAQTNAYVQLGTGLNVRAAAGQLVAADASFQITAAGAESRGTAHQVIAPADLWLGDGIQVIQSDGQRLVFSTAGPGLF